MTTLSLNLFLDKKQNTVLFAECDRIFVETLLSFLTLPLGTIIRLLNKQTTVGCLDKLYASVEQLDEQYLQTSACRDMLLQPRSEAGQVCEDLLKTVDDLNPRGLYRCENWKCFTKTHPTFSMTAGVPCRCEQPMDEYFTFSKHATSDLSRDGGVYLKGLTGFIISDDLHIMATSTSAIISLLQKHGMDSIQHTVMKTVQVDKSQKKMLELLRRSFLSSTPLTDVFLAKKGQQDSLQHKAGEETKLIDMVEIDEKSNGVTKANGIAVKLLQSKYSNKIVFAEAGDDLVNLLFGFLTFPLGLIVKLLSKKNSSSVGSVWNLYNSVKSLSRSGHMKPECEALLVDPRLAPFYGCSNQIINNIQEMPPSNCSVINCSSCFQAGIPKDKCLHGGMTVHLSLINPKLPNSRIDKGGGFVKSSARFIVTNGMVVTPFSCSAVFNLMKDTHFLINDLVEKEITIAEPEVLQLLRSCITSRTCLIDAFSHKIKEA